MLAAALGGCGFEPGGLADPTDPGLDPGLELDAGSNVDAPAPVEPVVPAPLVCRVVDAALGVPGVTVQVGPTVVTFMSWATDSANRLVGFTLSPAAAGLRYEVRVGRERFVTEGLTFTIPAGPRGTGPIDRVDFCVSDVDDTDVDDGRR